MQRFNNHGRSSASYKGAFIASLIINICLVALMVILLTTPGLLIPADGSDSDSDVIEVVADEYSGEEAEHELPPEDLGELEEPTVPSEETTTTTTTTTTTQKKNSGNKTTAKKTTTTTTTTTTTAPTGDNDVDYTDFF